VTDIYYSFQNLISNFILLEAFKYAIDEGKYQVNKGLIDGYHVGVNMHRAGGQTVDWPHVHFIPRLLHDSGY
jgi:diadenosine tetraphosphate (Ap4A) HIT family hydrolase